MSCPLTNTKSLEYQYKIDYNDRDPAVEKIYHDVYVRVLHAPMLDSWWAMGAAGRPLERSAGGSIDAIAYKVVHDGRQRRADVAACLPWQWISAADKVPDYLNNLFPQGMKLPCNKTHFLNDRSSSLCGDQDGWLSLRCVVSSSSSSSTRPLGP